MMIVVGHLFCKTWSVCVFKLIHFIIFEYCESMVYLAFCLAGGGGLFVLLKLYILRYYYLYNAYCVQC
jgi:hypothetical protein